MNPDQLKTLSRDLEALLFWKSEPMSAKEIAKIFQKSENEVAEIVEELQKNLNGRGIVLVRNKTEISLATAPESATLIEKMTLDEHSADLGRAALETLSIILYKGPIRRSEIDHIRGVNSSFILRNLLIRGLVQKVPDPKDSRTSIYSASFELLGHLGIAEISKLPDYEKVQQEINKFNEQQ